MIPEASAPFFSETIDSLVTQGIGIWKDFLSQEIILPDNNQQKLSASLASILQSLHALILVNYNNHSPVDDRCWCRLQAFCYLIKGVNLVVTLKASKVMSPTSHEQMVTLRQAVDNTDTSPLSSSFLLSGPLQDLRTVPLPQSLLTAHKDKQPTSALDAVADTRWLAVNILELMKNGDFSLTDADGADSSASMLCIEMARLWTELSGTGDSRGCHDTGDLDCLWAHGVLAMLHDLLETTIPIPTVRATTTTTFEVDGISMLGVDFSMIKSQQQPSLRQHLPVLSSAACVAMLSTVLHLVDRPSLPSQALGSMLLWELLAGQSSR